MPQNRLPRQILHELDRASQLLPKTIRREIVNLLVRVPVRGYLMSSVMDSTNQIRVLLSNLSQYKTSCPHVVTGHKIEEPPHAGLNATLKLSPLVHGNLNSLVPILDVNGENVVHMINRDTQNPKQTDKSQMKPSSCKPPVETTPPGQDAS